MDRFKTIFLFGMTSIFLFLYTNITVVGDTKFSENAKNIDWNASFAKSIESIQEVHERVLDTKTKKFDAVLSRIERAIEASEGTRREEQLENVRIVIQELSDYLDLTIDKNYKNMTNPRLYFLSKEFKIKEGSLPEDYISGQAETLNEEWAYRSWRWEIKSIKDLSDRSGRSNFAVFNTIPLSVWYKGLKELEAYLGVENIKKAKPSLRRLHRSLGSIEGVRSFVIKRAAVRLKRRILKNVESAKRYPVLSQSTNGVYPEKEKKFYCNKKECSLKGINVVMVRPFPHRKDCYDGSGVYLSLKKTKLRVTDPKCYGQFQIIYRDKSIYRQYRGSDIKKVAFHPLNHQSLGIDDFEDKTKVFQAYVREHYKDLQFIDEISSASNESLESFDVFDGVVYNEALERIMKQNVKIMDINSFFFANVVMKLEKLRQINAWTHQNIEFIDRIRFEHSDVAFNDDVVLDLVSSLRRLAVEKIDLSNINLKERSVYDGSQLLRLMKERGYSQTGFGMKFSAMQSPLNKESVLNRLHRQAQILNEMAWCIDTYGRINECDYQKYARHAYMLEFYLETFLKDMGVKKLAYQINSSFSGADNISYLSHQNVKASILNWVLLDDKEIYPNVTFNDVSTEHEFNKE